MITQQILQELFIYNSGNLLWKTNRRKNSIKENSIAGNLSKNGYYRTFVNGKAIYNHRAIFFMHHGYLPKMLDHINGMKTDNRIENLREATYEQNNANKAMQKNNKSGCRCVFWHKPTSLWVVLIRKNNKQHCFGYYKSYEEACSVANNKRKELHNEFSRGLS